MQQQMLDMQLMQQQMMQQQQFPPAFNNYQSSRYQQNLTFVPQASSQYQNAQQSPSLSQRNMFRSMPNILPLSTPLRVPLSEDDARILEQTRHQLIFDDDNEDPNNIPQNNNRGNNSYGN
jgi:hypothetical protein